MPRVTRQTVKANGETLTPTGKAVTVQEAPKTEPLADLKERYAAGAPPEVTSSTPDERPKRTYHRRTKAEIEAERGGRSFMENDPNREETISGYAKVGIALYQQLEQIMPTKIPTTPEESAFLGEPFGKVLYKYLPKDAEWASEAMLLLATIAWLLPRLKKPSMEKLPAMADTQS